MKLLAHLVTTDLRRFRLVILVFVSLLAVATTLDIVRPIASGNTGVRISLGTAAMLIWVAELLLSLVVVAAVVHEHPLVGSDAFWMTRPIPPRTLMWSKILLLAILVVGLPSICDIVLMSAYHVPPAQVVGVIMQALILRTLWLTLLMCVASLTRNLAGFGLLCGGALVSAALTIVISTIVTVARMNDAGVGFVTVAVDPRVNPLVSNESDSTSGLVLTLLVIAAGVAMLTVQYHWRLRRRSVPGGIAGVALAFGIASVWPWPVLQTHLVVPEWAHASTSLRLAADPETVNFDTGREWGATPRKWRMGRARLTLSEVAPGWLARVRVANASLALADGARLDGRGVSYAEPVPIGPGDEVQERSVSRGVLGVTRLEFVGQQGRANPVVLVMREAEFLANKDKTSSYTGTFVIELSHEEIAASLPLQRGAVFQDGTDRFVIDDVRLGQDPSLRIRRSGAASIFDRRAPRTYAYYLRNKRMGEAVPASALPLLQQSSGFGFFGGGHVEVAAGLGFDADADLVSRRGNASPDDPIVIDDEWIAGADLVIVRTTRAGAVTRTLEIAGFEIRQKPTKQSPAAF